MSETKSKFYDIFSTILCGRCICGGNLWFSAGNVYQSSSYCTIHTLIENIEIWLDKNRNDIDEAFDEYNKVNADKCYEQVSEWRYRDEYTGEYIILDKLDRLSRCFITNLPILNSIKNDYGHIVCMLDYLRIK